MKKRIFLFITIILLVVGCEKGSMLVELNPLGSENFLQPRIELNCSAACVIDVKTGRILFEKNSSQRIPPASMTKIMTTRIILKEVEKGKISLSDKIRVSRNADYRSLPRDSSLMFLEEGQVLTYSELLKGLAVASGNDGAVAAAENLFGSMELFIAEMNSEAKRLGLENTHFVEPSGYSDSNYTTAKDFARLSWFFVKDFPGDIKEYFALRSFAYPKSHNGSSSIGTIEQNNYNELLLTNFQGVTGLKTGYIDASGHNLAFSVSRDGFDIVGVVMGCRSYDSNYRNGSLVRAVDAATLATYIYSTYNLIDLSKLYQMKVKETKDAIFYAQASEPLNICLSFVEASKLSVKFEGKKAGVKTAGEFVFFLGEKELAREVVVIERRDR
ncbi:MAG: D-alanyl-D-alanine carboxypeptidase [Spirochaetales bacterium]|nr:D-alanyl-D-alanine carboxypeptidase [Spirochaetales bacterium]